MFEQVIGRGGRPMRGDVGRTGDEASPKGADAPGEEAGIGQVAETNRRVEALTGQVDECVAVRGVHMQQRVPACQFSEDRSQMRGDRKSTRLNSSHLGSSYAVF